MGQYVSSLLGRDHQPQPQEYAVPTLPRVPSAWTKKVPKRRVKRSQLAAVIARPRKQVYFMHVESNTLYRVEVVGTGTLQQVDVYDAAEPDICVLSETCSQVFVDDGTAECKRSTCHKGLLFHLHRLEYLMAADVLRRIRVQHPIRRFVVSESGAYAIDEHGFYYLLHAGVYLENVPASYQHRPYAYHSRLIRITSVDSCKPVVKQFESILKFYVAGQETALLLEACPREAFSRLTRSAAESGHHCGPRREALLHVDTLTDAQRPLSRSDFIALMQRFEAKVRVHAISAYESAPEATLHTVR